MYVCRSEHFILFFCLFRSPTTIQSYLATVVVGAARLWCRRKSQCYVDMRVELRCLNTPMMHSTAQAQLI